MRLFRTTGLLSAACLAIANESGSASAASKSEIDPSTTIPGSDVAKETLPNHDAGLGKTGSAPFIPQGALAAPEGDHVAVVETDQGKFGDKTLDTKEGVIAKQLADTHGTGSMPEQVVV